MTPTEAKKLVAVLIAAYPNAADKFTEQTVQVYTQMLGDLDYPDADKAVRALLAENKFLPTIAEIRERAASRAIDATSPEIAWGEVRREIRRVGIYGTPQFDDPLVTAAVATLGWRELCDMRADDRGVYRAHFVRTYQAFQDRAMREQNADRLLEHVDPRRLQGLHDKSQDEHETRKVVAETAQRLRLVGEGAE